MIILKTNPAHRNRERRGPNNLRRWWCWSICRTKEFFTDRKAEAGRGWDCDLSMRAAHSRPNDTMESLVSFVDEGRKKFLSSAVKWLQDRCYSLRNKKAATRCHYDSTSTLLGIIIYCHYLPVSGKGSKQSEGDKTNFWSVFTISATVESWALFPLWFQVTQLRREIE
jgi:hypothetical protein